MPGGNKDPVPSRNLKSHHDDKSVRDGYSWRSLENSFPKLCEYLRKGDHVLDVGCGPGTITLDVAEFVYPGKVIGIDIAENAIKDARKAAKERNIENVEFVVRDACALPFKDGQFDVVYEHILLKWLRNPLDALKEQKRVARKGGLVVSTAPLDYHAMYPVCPSLEKVFNAWKYWEDPLSDNFVWDNSLGLRIVDLLRTAGFKSIKTFPDSSTSIQLGGLVKFLLNEEGTLKKGYDHLFNIGALTKEDMAEARLEVKKWHQDSARFYCGMGLMTVARA